jgi:hypothetical protein
MEAHGSLPTAVGSDKLGDAPKLAAPSTDLSLSSAAPPGRGDTVPTNELNESTLGAPEQQFVSGVVGQETSDVSQTASGRIALTGTFEKLATPQGSSQHGLGDLPLPMKITGYSSVEVTYHRLPGDASFLPRDDLKNVMPPTHGT